MRRSKATKPATAGAARGLREIVQLATANASEANRQPLKRQARRLMHLERERRRAVAARRRASYLAELATLERQERLRQREGLTDDSFIITGGGSGGLPFVTRYGGDGLFGKPPIVWTGSDYGSAQIKALELVCNDPNAFIIDYVGGLR